MATPEHNRKRRWRTRHLIELAVAVLAVALVATAGAAVFTDKQDYSPGSVVTISGDNSNDAGYVEGNTVDVAVSGPNGWSSSCSATVGGNGSWSCQVTLSSDPAVAVGDYSYTATSTDADGNTISESGTFTDAINFAIDSVSLAIHWPSSCTTGSSPFTSGATVCARASVVISPNGNGSPNTGPTLYVYWLGPSSTTVPVFSDSQTNLQASQDVDFSHAVTEAGTWTVKACKTNTLGSCNGGNLLDTDTFVVSAPADTTAPVISYLLNPASPNGDNGWYKSNVALTWTVTENESPGSLVKTGCVNQNITADQVATTYSCSATSTGGSAGPVNVTIKRDASAPTVSVVSVKNANNTAYTPGTWTNQDVTVAFSCVDNGPSGVASLTPDPVTKGEGEDQTASTTCTDNAGNTDTGSISNIDVDKTKPTITVSHTPDGSNGWNVTDPVSVSIAASDALSGLAGAPTCTDGASSLMVSGSSSPFSASVTGEGNHNISCTVNDNAGNTSDAGTDTVKIDTIKPTITASAKKLPSNAPYSSGTWTNQTVEVSFTCLDTGGSGVAASGCPGAQQFTTDTPLAGTNVSATATDIAGNTSDPSTTINVKVDKTKPVVTVTGVTDGATYVLGSVPAAGCDTTDALSGVKSAASLGSSGGPVGSITATCSGAEDNAGNTNSASVTYTVIYKWTGFFRPVDNLPTLNSVKAGSAIPVKFSLSGNQGLNVFAAGYPTSNVAACDASQGDDPIEETVNAGGSSLSYDPVADQYNYVWKTDKKWASTCRQLRVKLMDGTLHAANFMFK